jgi:hypothetical protein
VSQLPKTSSGKLELVTELANAGLLSRDEMLAFLDGMTLQEYLASKTKLGKLLAGKYE